MKFFVWNQREGQSWNQWEIKSSDFQAGPLSSDLKQSLVFDQGSCIEILLQIELQGSQVWPSVSKIISLRRRKNKILMSLHFTRRSKPTCNNFIPPDGHVVIPVWPRLLVIKSQSMQDLVFHNCCVVTPCPNREVLASLQVPHHGPTPEKERDLTVC